MRRPPCASGPSCTEQPPAKTALPAAGRTHAAHMEQKADIGRTGDGAHPKPGETKPGWPHQWRKGSLFRSLFVDLFFFFEYVTGWYYYLFGHIASFRFLLQFSAVLLFAFGIYGVTIDIEKRQIDRGVREATLFAMIARTHALPEGKGSRALKPSVEALARDGVAMKEIDLSGADLRGANLAGAKLRRADLSGAILVEADLSGADLRGAKLGGAVFIRANLTDADLCEADLSGADLVGAVFEEAFMEKVDMTEADLLVADFSNAQLAGAIVTSANAPGRTCPMPASTTRSFRGRYSTARTSAAPGSIGPTTSPTLRYPAAPADLWNGRSDGASGGMTAPPSVPPGRHELCVREKGVLVRCQTSNVRRVTELVVGGRPVFEAARTVRSSAAPVFDRVAASDLAPCPSRPTAAGSGIDGGTTRELAAVGADHLDPGRPGGVHAGARRTMISFLPSAAARRRRSCGPAPRRRASRLSDSRRRPRPGGRAGPAGPAHRWTTRAKPA